MSDYAEARQAAFDALHLAADWIDAYEAHAGEGEYPTSAELLLPSVAAELRRKAERIQRATVESLAAKELGIPVARLDKAARKA